MSLRNPASSAFAVPDDSDESPTMRFRVEVTRLTVVYKGKAYVMNIITYYLPGRRVSIVM